MLWHQLYGDIHVTNIRTEQLIKNIRILAISRIYGRYWLCIYSVNDREKEKETMRKGEKEKVIYRQSEPYSLTK